MAFEPRALQVILGNQLFPVDYLRGPDEIEVFMAEDMGLCTYVRHHQQKIVLFLAAMREYADGLRDAGYTVHYEMLDPADERDYFAKLEQAVESSGAAEIVHFEIEDEPVESRLVAFAESAGLERTEIVSPMFLCGRAEFAEFASGGPPLRMADFYRRQRRRLGILVEADKRPTGGRWSFDSENRRKLPRTVEPPLVPAAVEGKHAAAVIDLVRKAFPGHPGDARQFAWPTRRAEALRWLDDFLEQRFADFGPYEDAITRRSETVFHSLLSPLLNLGLLVPSEVVERALEFASSCDIPLSSVEGFVRQVTGWREFVRGVYRQFGARQESSNFWNHERELTSAWYDGTTGIPILDDTIKTALARGWTHHIPRLMVVANLMTLCEIRPQSAHRWFMEMYVDSSEWVMGPNVYGMGLFSDGGIFATKPYICGSSYLLRMSDYPKGAWCDVVDGLFWRFIDRHRDFFASNPRLALMPSALDRIDAERRRRLFSAAESFIGEFTC